MKKQFLAMPVTILLSAFILSNCKKSETTPVKTKTEMISQSSWKFDNAKVGGNDVSAFVEACQKDNILVFVSTGMGTVDEGPTKCNSGDQQTTPFTWNFQNNETILHVSTIFFTGGSSDFTIVSLSETQFVLSQNITVSGTTQNAVVTLKH